MPSELSTAAQTPSVAVPNGEVGGAQDRDRWRSAPKPSTTLAPPASAPSHHQRSGSDSSGPTAVPIASEPATEPESADDSLELAAPVGVRWRMAQWIRWPRLVRRRVSPWLGSLIVHAALLIALGLWITKPEVPGDGPTFSITATDRGDFGSDQLQAEADMAGSTFATSESLFSPANSATPAEVLQLDLETPIDASTATNLAPSLKAIERSLAGAGEQSTNWGAVVTKGSGYSGRSPAARGKLASQGGGSNASEQAVENGLRWLLAHQHDDGSWRFTFDGLPCNNACHNPGTESTSTGSTALALLPFLGAGYTHQQGPYQEQISRGLYYLCNRMLIIPQGGDLQEGTMYAQGLATIVLCEAYGMTKDEKLRPYAEQAVKFVLYAQDLRGGGWRYTPGMPGDTTMTGWQMMSLKSARMAGLEVPSTRFFLTGKFLDGVQSERGAAYGYRTTNKRASTTAVGLLCRMYLGWGRTHPGVRDGVQFFDRLGPSPTDMYMNYYATQLMFHHGGAPWDRWNKKMRDYLIQTQAKEGHESGSWHFDDPHGNAGGRLYTTAISILILEVYYRYLPLYSTRAVDEGF